MQGAGEGQLTRTLMLIHNVSQAHTLTRKVTEEKFSAMAHCKKEGGQEQRGGYYPTKVEIIKCNMADKLIQSGLTLKPFAQKVF